MLLYRFTLFPCGKSQLDPLVLVRGDVVPGGHVAKQLWQRERVIAEDAILSWRESLGLILGDEGLLFALLDDGGLLFGGHGLFFELLGDDGRSYLVCETVRIGSKMPCYGRNHNNGRKNMFRP